MLNHGLYSSFVFSMFDFCLQVHLASFYLRVVFCRQYPTAILICLVTLNRFNPIGIPEFSGVMQSRILTTFSNTVMCNAAVADAVWLH